MKSLIRFVDVWEKTGKIEEIISQNLDFPPSDEIQAYLSSLPTEDHDRIRKSLKNAMAALQSHNSGLEAEASLLKTQIDQNIQASNACLVYNKVPRKPRA